jgi:hypothetical protein
MNWRVEDNAGQSGVIPRLLVAVMGGLKNVKIIPVLSSAFNCSNGSVYLDVQVPLWIACADNVSRERSLSSLSHHEPLKVDLLGVLVRMSSCLIVVRQE